MNCDGGNGGASPDFSTPGSRPAGQQCVLLVDDDEDERDLLREVLEAAGYTVELASNGREALDYLIAETSEPVAIVLDLEMPGMSGDEFLRVINRYIRLARIPVIISSGRNLESHRIQGMYTAHLKKPYAPERLRDALTAVLKQVE